jgi:hypothetical protein
MTQYDAGPGDWSDRPWDDPEKKPKPQARRRRVILPPWALLAILVALVILVCASLVLIIRAIRGGGEEELPTPLPTVTAAAPAPATATVTLLTPTSAITPTNTVVLPIESQEPTQPPTEIGPGALVIVEGTVGAGLNLREQPTTYARVVGNAPEGTVLTVLEGPRDADGYVWWRLRAPDGAEGWGAANWLVLKTE